jgi:3-isopropylmalate/(R)-2-methylmalate dehydratase small subunit
MRPVTVVDGPMVPLYRADIDTDQIMPKQFLKRVERTGFGEVIFLDWRSDPGFVLNDERYAGARVLVTGPNFGAGSSREHAPWGLQQYGFEAIVAPSFADIFAGNCAKIGLLLVTLPAPLCEQLASTASRTPGAGARIDLAAQRLTADGVETTFEIDPVLKVNLLEGLDDIGLTLRGADAIERYERTRSEWLPMAAEPVLEIGR